MKKFFQTIAMLFFSVAMIGCVEINEDYDISKINKEEITIGNEFIAPIAKITTSIADMHWGLEDEIPTEDDNAQKEAAGSAVVEFTKSYTINGAIDQSVIEMLVANGGLYFRAEVENYSPIFFEADVQFNDTKGYAVCSPINKLLIAEGANEAATTSRVEIEITAQDIQAIGSAHSVQISLRTNLFEYTPKSEDKIVVNLKAKKTGGLSISL